jgi:biotin/methionine sulfoxide reductase|tara:strand:- start:924 stop:3251 length:2328 start_codon:yes stop_codon:yes gene_type:complete
MTKRTKYLTSTHWGNYHVDTENGRLISVNGSDNDENSSPIGQSLLSMMDENSRISQPMIREGFLNTERQSDGTKRGQERFVKVSWDTAFQLAAKALSEVKENYGNEAIFGGSYGWSSAGRFHHAQSQVHRFLNKFGGYVSSRDTYSVGAGFRILPYTLGIDGVFSLYQAVQVKEMVGHTELMVCFGGLSMKNTQVDGGGVGNHSALGDLQRLKESNIECVNVSPMRDDMADFLNAQWMANKPNTDTALMLGLAHTIYTEDLHDRSFLNKYTVGFEKFVPYLMGESDSQPKDAQWAATITGVSKVTILKLARTMAMKSTLIGASWSLQRAEHGEQPWWMALTLACMLGYIGKKGCGLNYGFGSVHSVGFSGRKAFSFERASFPQGVNAIDKYIPVARIADMLLNPGDLFDYDGRKLRYPDIKAVVWAGGNPFHHHQDLNKLIRAWAKPEVIIVNEIFWNSNARRADIVFPATSMLERNDMSGGSNDHYITPNKKIIEPFALAKNDYEIYSGIAEKLGIAAQFTEGKTADEWVRHLYNTTRANAQEKSINLPAFDDFIKGDSIDLSPQLEDQQYLIEKFIEDPNLYPVTLTESGKFEIFSETIGKYELDDCPPHPTWMEKEEWLGSKRALLYPLHLISNQPKNRLHSQLDHGPVSRKSKINGREVMLIHNVAALERGLRSDDIVRLFNDRGSCLAAVQLTDDIRPDVVVLPTGAWFDPEDSQVEGSMDIHGNPNILTRDVGSSKLGQGCTAHSCLVDVEKYTGKLPPIKVFSLPDIR